MSTQQKVLSAKTLRELLRYDPITGIFTWRVRRTGKAVVGALAGYQDGHDRPSGFQYWMISIYNRGYKRSRLAWLYFYGRWPSGEIDHRDGNESNDAICNLRDVTRLQNSFNTRGRKHNLAGLKGVRKISIANRPALKKPWNARITIDGVEKSLGYFSSDLEAAAAYDKAALKLHGQFAKTNKMLGLLR